MNFIIYPQQDNTIAIITPCDSIGSALKDVPENTPYKIVETIDIDTEFFNAYEFDNNRGVKINISKAKAIYLNKFRAARKPLLEKLDVNFMRAVESGDTTLQHEIAAKKQALRDVTSTELPDTLEGIKSTWPEILGQNPFA